MEIDQNYDFSIDRVLTKIKNTLWNIKVEGVEELLKELIDYDNKALLKLLKTNKAFNQIINLMFHSLNNDTSFKLLEVQMDFLEFLLTSLPESLFEQIENLLISLLRLIQNRRESI